MDKSAHSSSITVKRAFGHFLEGSSFVRRTRKSYAEDLKPLLTHVDQAPITAASVPMLIVSHIANQIQCSVTGADLINYDLSGTRRTIFKSLVPIYRSARTVKKFSLFSQSCFSALRNVWL